jgi:hypothetical protein
MSPAFSPFILPPSSFILDSMHVVLLGDSIFDNESYVPGGAPVIEQLRRKLPRGARATLLAVDGAVTSGVARQLARLPADATHLVVSVGGNDGLRHIGLIEDGRYSAPEGFRWLADAQREFRRDYQEMLKAVLSAGKPAAVCTVYDAVPGLVAPAVTALSVFNDVILREAFRSGLPVLDLRMVCTEPGDYSAMSPIEPSEAGGLKIVSGIAAILTAHDFKRGQSVVYGR